MTETVLMMMMIYGTLMDDWLSVKQRQYQIYERESSSYKQAKITTQINPCILSVPHPELSGYITTLSVCNTP